MNFNGCTTLYSDSYVRYCIDEQNEFNNAYCNYCGSELQCVGDSYTENYEDICEKCNETRIYYDPIATIDFKKEYEYMISELCINVFNEYKEGKFNDYDGNFSDYIFVDKVTNYLRETYSKTITKISGSENDNIKYFFIPNCKNISYDSDGIKIGFNMCFKNEGEKHICMFTDEEYIIFNNGEVFSSLETR